MSAVAGFISAPAQTVTMLDVTRCARFPLKEVFRRELSQSQSRNRMLQQVFVVSPREKAMPRLFGAAVITALPGCLLATYESQWYGEAGIGRGVQGTHPKNLAHHPMSLKSLCCANSPGKITFRANPPRHLPLYRAMLERFTENLQKPRRGLSKRPSNIQSQ